MEHAIQKGNPIVINWAFYGVDGEGFSLDGLSPRLFYTNGGGKSMASGVSIMGNVLSWGFTPDQQWKSGNYDLLLEVYSNGTKVVSIFYPGAFSLLSSYGETPEQSTATQTEATTLNIKSTCDFYHFMPVVPVVGDDGKWYVNGVACKDEDDNPIYAYPTLTIENDGTIIINDGRFNEETVTVLKNAIDAFCPTVGVDGSWYINDEQVKDPDNHPVYASPTITIENDLTVVFNKGRYNESSSTAIKDSLVLLVEGTVGEDNEFTPTEAEAEDILNAYLAGRAVILSDTTSGDYETIFAYESESGKLLSKTYWVGTNEEE